MLFSPICTLCADHDGGQLGICQACLQDLPWHKDSQCPQCALLTFGSQICGTCLSTPPAFDRTRALFKYEFPLSNMLQRYKYNEMLSMASILGELASQSVCTSDLPDLLIPMPLHPKRLQERGFNQSLEIARIVSNKLGITLDAKSCERIKLSPPQASLPYKERLTNMKNAFSCKANFDGLRIALLDDVMTTGASLQALAKVVKGAGASHVECWTIARTL